MIKNSFMVLSFFILSLYSCKSGEEISRQKLKQCIDTNLEEIRKTYSPNISQYMSLETTLITFEKFLLSENYLNETDKESYSILIQNIVKNPNKYSKIYQHLIDRDIYLDELVLLSPSLVLYQCVNHVLVTEQNDSDSTLNHQKIAIDGIVDSNYRNLDSIQLLFDVTTDKEFSKLLYRIPFIYIITMNAEKNDYSKKELN